jgi:hypothetical protein
MSTISLAVLALLAFQTPQETEARYNTLSYDVNNQWDRDSPGPPERHSSRPAASRCGRSQTAGADRPWVERSIVSVDGVRADRRSDAGHGRLLPRSGARIFGRPHVLSPARCGKLSRLCSPNTEEPVERAAAARISGHKVSRRRSPRLFRQGVRGCGRGWRG